MGGICGEHLLDIYGLRRATVLTEGTGHHHWLHTGKHWQIVLLTIAVVTALYTDATDIHGSIHPYTLFKVYRTSAPS